MGILSQIESLEPEWLRRIHVPTWVVIVLTVVFLLRLPTLFEPYHQIVESQYIATAEAIKRGVTAFAEAISVNPPFLYFLATITEGLFWLRAVLLLWVLGTVLMFWKLADVLFPKDKAVSMAATIVFAMLVSLPAISANVASEQMFSLAPVLAGFLMLVRGGKKHSFILSGALFSFAYLVSFYSIYDFFAAALLLLIVTHKNKAALAKNLASFLGGAVFPLLPFFAWHLAHGKLGLTVNTMLQLGSAEHSHVYYSVLGALLLCVYFLRRNLSRQFMFMVVWSMFTLLSVLLHGHGSGGAHQLTQLVPAASLLIGVLIAKQSLEQSLSVLPLFLIALAVANMQITISPSLAYYGNFVKFVTGKTSKTDYFRSFSRGTPHHYELAGFIVSSSTPQEKIFMWGESAPHVYALSKRLPTSDIQSEVPKFVIVDTTAAGSLGLNQTLRSNYLLIHVIDNFEIWKKRGR